MGLSEIKWCSRHWRHLASGDECVIDWGVVVSMDAHHMVQDGAAGVATQVEVAVLSQVHCRKSTT